LAAAEQTTLAILRRMIVEGELSAGERLNEVSVAAKLGVSRTPAKFALAKLEATGLISKLAGRGYQVREIKPGDLETIVALRGVLEGVAASSMAKNGMTDAVRRDLTRSLMMTENVVRKRSITLEDIDVFQDANTLFHETIMNNCGNEFVKLSYEPIRHLPLAALGTFALNVDQLEKEILRMSVGHAQHVVIRKSIEDGDAMRAELVMREHSNAMLEYDKLFVEEKTPAQLKAG